MSKIIILTGSPRANGNTMTLVDAFTKTVERNGHTVKQYDTAKMKVVGCRACDSCYKNGKACMFDEGFNEIAYEIEAADAVVFAAPVYWYSFPAQLKAVIDKFFSLYMKSDRMAGKKSALISVAGEPNLSVFDGMVTPYKGIYKLMNWESVGQVLIPGVMDVGDIEKTDGIKQTITLASKF